MKERLINLALKGLGVVVVVVVFTVVVSMWSSAHLACWTIGCY